MLNSKIQTFNEFFYRKLKPDARPVTSPDDPKVITSAADCRYALVLSRRTWTSILNLVAFALSFAHSLTVFEDISIAKKIWVKGKQFTLPHLFDDESIAALPAFSEGAAIAIFRLAPAGMWPQAPIPGRGEGGGRSFCYLLIGKSWSLWARFRLSSIP